MDSRKQKRRPKASFSEFEEVRGVEDITCPIEI